MIETTAPMGELVDGRYRVDALLGEGGMARVFRATDEALGRIVALKIFRPGTADDADTARKRSEMQLLASLSHPSLVTLFDARLDTPDGAYLVMEYIEGNTLTERLRAGAIERADAAGLAGDLGEALHVVHEAGVIHRDVKPSNVLLRPPLIPGHSFRATLADFGIAYLVDTARVTTPGMVVGTPAYLAPEQVRGAEPTAASDIYSLGLVVIEALTGERPFGAMAAQEALAARLGRDPEVPEWLGPQWSTLLSAMTARDPDTRPTALEVARAARELDSAVVTDEDPDATVASPTAGRGAMRRAEARAQTPDETTATKVFGVEADAAAPISTETTVPPDPPASRSRPRWIMPGLIGVVALIVAVVVGASVWTSLSSGNAPETPTLPAVEEPLNSDLQELLETVTP
jgi:serine/threonine protein kinase